MIPPPPRSDLHKIYRVLFKGVNKCSNFGNEPGKMSTFALKMHIIKYKLIRNVNLWILVQRKR